MPPDAFAPTLKKALPESLLAELRGARARRKLRRSGARKAFEAAPETPAWLDRSQLEQLHAEYPTTAPASDWRPPSTEDVSVLGRERAGALLSRLGGDGRRLERFLELACANGMVSACLRGQGKTTTAIDIRASIIDPRALEAGVDFAPMNAERLAFDDESFDCVFSFDAFEHISDPDGAFAEAVRVTRHA